MSSLNVNEAKELEQVKKSFERCIAQPHFFDDFYELFFKSDKRIPELFKDTDFNVQRVAIQHGISYMIMFAEGSKIANAKIESLSIKHDRNHLNIHPELYDKWLHALIKTIELHDKEFNEDLKNAWIRILGYVITRIKSRY